jgi:hypothetical protein
MSPVKITFWRKKPQYPTSTLKESVDKNSRPTRRFLSKTLAATLLIKSQPREERRTVFLVS